LVECTDCPQSGSYQFVPYSYPSDPILSCCGLPRNRFSSHSSRQIVLRNLEQIGRLKPRKQIEHPCDNSCPSGLVAGPKPRAVIPMEVLVEQNVVFPMAVFLKLLGSSIDGALAVRVASWPRPFPTTRYCETRAWEADAAPRSPDPGCGP